MRLAGKSLCQILLRPLSVGCCDSYIPLSPPAQTPSTYALSATYPPRSTSHEAPTRSPLCTAVLIHAHGTVAHLILSALVDPPTPLRCLALAS
ncbi:hypothetical protein BOTBODRAFT_37469 [Botryobasidium botryosum FD-172 SS1]|uniref:Uncharacterized protein n=1 Tax=Botryobasidium botryosum (strain FD-172 SS1) TaxID=930990 RepID=A0A067M0A0_BOTB1|nr:hypothetical protein BOTBODRAFT_37469 [Botryobasidium botryosum FD-172 SS1]